MTATATAMAATTITAPADAARSVAHLVERARRGSLTAYAELVRRYQGRLYNFLLRRSGSSDLAEEIAQEALVRAASACALDNGLGRASLVSLGSATGYWRRHGYSPMDPASAGLAEKLAGYGPQALYMSRALPL